VSKSQNETGKIGPILYASKVKSVMWSQKNGGSGAYKLWGVEVKRLRWENEAHKEEKNKGENGYSTLLVLT